MGEGVSCRGTGVTFRHYFVPTSFVSEVGEGVPLVEAEVGREEEMAVPDSSDQVVELTALTRV